MKISINLKKKKKKKERKKRKKEKKRYVAQQRFNLTKKERIFKSFAKQIDTLTVLNFPT